MRKEMFTDAEIIRNLANDQESSATIRQLYRENFDLLSRYVQNNSGSEQDAEDIFQEVMVAFIQLLKAGRFRGESSIRTFLFSLNKNIWLNELKRRGRASKREEKYEKNMNREVQTADIAMELQQTRSELLNTLEALGENCKKILLLFYYENKSMKEMVGELPYENEQVVRNKKSKCLKKLAELVKGNPLLYDQLKNFVHE
ncbi:RNA polymerase sigma factor [Flavisolibacter nicotianae]|uniref:RNA polymerase sigma factor n=1 Tax=Flavisolibacter nicotianae TaxID=2364882 RepID=UPI0013C41D43|nr:sigma-70 family RNA polymerase sigma factor [Flavisolibacter nicotianae]